LFIDGFVTFIAPRERDSATYPAGFGIAVQKLSSKDFPVEEITRVQLKILTEKHRDFQLQLIQSSSTTSEGNPGTQNGVYFHRR
jgi:hypothetical protein